MRVLHVIPSLSKGGAERYCADICRELNCREGVEVLLLSMSEANSYSFITDGLHYKTCHSKVLPSITKKDIADTEEYDSIVADFKPDIIHSHLFWAELLTRRSPLPTVKYVTHCQNNMPEFRNFDIRSLFKKSTWTSSYEKKWIIERYRRCKNNFLVISKDTEDYYRNVLPDDLQRITLMYHAIDFNKFNKANTDRIISLNKLRLLYVARFAVYKNHSFLVDIVGALKRRGIDVYLDFLGNGELFEEVKRKAEGLDIIDLINFAGEVDDVESYLNKANFYVHPAYYEPFGLVIIEAMAAGLPVVCLDGKGNRDLIVQGKNGFMFFEQDVNLFANKIIELSNDPVQYQDMSDYAVSYAKGYDIKNHADKLISYYNSL
jgi:glycosyltransferase involved in cell wall biosynthesis